ncbi:PREDICTED: uncharacterized protein LOC104592576 [Nelumbo nucifera]|uniref:Uncharacterized protein LOC104592576 n=2 Tax=Nelumbo nucifera TaxID=4432 RepID=A0A1U7ZC95_NELNU|nr:PREDICTED: uncharacterized protein LOC104592576 [Nelumbo nucifera]DAD45093.1 TPA_asm: hypothetical protein HUJ06_003323 [Nelumbo nucifera]
MASSSRTRSSGPVVHLSNGFHRSISPGRFSSPTASSSASAFASSSSSFTSRSTGFFTRSASPTRVNLYGSHPCAPSVRFSLDRSISPNRSIAVAPRNQVVRKLSNPLSAPSSQKRTCLCSPTSHPGSFRCSLHKNMNNQAVSYPSNRLNARRSAMTNSLVRIGTVEGEWVKRALAALIRPSSHQQRRRAAFQPRPSRLSIMSKAEDL